jgi:hypothetical protein
LVFEPIIIHAVVLDGLLTNIRKTGSGKMIEKKFGRSYQTSVIIASVLMAGASGKIVIIPHKGEVKTL